MFESMKRRAVTVASGAVGLSVVTASMVALSAVGPADAAQRQATASSAQQVQSLRTASTSPNQVRRHSWIRGTTANGRNVTGQFRPKSFSVRGDHLAAIGRLRLVIHRLSDNSVKRVIVKRGAVIPLKTVNGTAASQPTAARQLAGPAAAAAAAAGSCPVLNLVLGPLHLDLLGLTIDLNKVVLNIVAVSGTGNLLGNLLCAVAGLLDPTGGTLGQLADLLNAILAILQQ